MNWNKSFLSLLYRVIDTILAMQHPDGGFGGGPKQSPHLLSTYAAVCTLAIVGRPGPGGGWDEINRYVELSQVRHHVELTASSKGLYNFFLSVKQSSGSFQAMTNGEVDIRCASVEFFFSVWVSLGYSSFHVDAHTVSLLSQQCLTSSLQHLQKESRNSYAHVRPTKADSHAQAIHISSMINCFPILCRLWAKHMAATRRVRWLAGCYSSRFGKARRYPVLISKG